MLEPEKRHIMGGWKHRFCFFMLWCTVLFLVIYFSTLQDPWDSSLSYDLSKRIPHLDKVFHFMAYMIMTFSICLLIKRKKLKIWFVFLLCLLGILTEIMQLSFPNRTVSVFDAGSNIAGVILGYYLAWIIKKHRS